jgi:hypothetical protein
MNERDTPETDEAATYYNDLCDTPVSADFARRLERQRDEITERWERAANAYMIEQGKREAAERQRDEARETIAATLKALPVGYIPARTPESLPDRVADLLSQFSEASRQRDELLEALDDLINSPQPDEREGEFGRGTTPRKRAAAAIASVKGGQP